MKTIFISIAVYFSINLNLSYCQKFVTNNIVDYLNKNGEYVLDVINYSNNYWVLTDNKIIEFKDKIINEYYLNENSEGQLKDFIKKADSVMFPYNNTSMIWSNGDELWLIPQYISGESKNNVLLKIKNNYVYNYRIHFKKNITNNRICNMIFVNNSPLVLINIPIIIDNKKIDNLEVFELKNNVFMKSEKNYIKENERLLSLQLFNGREYLVTEEINGNIKILKLKESNNNYENIILDSSDKFHFGISSSNYMDSVLLISGNSDNNNRIYIYNIVNNKNIITMNLTLSLNNQYLFYRGMIYGICKDGLLEQDLSSYKQIYCLPPEFDKNCLLPYGKVKLIKNELWCIFDKLYFPCSDSISNVFLFQY